MTKELQELIDDWNELEAYRTLSGQPFNFGTGLITDDSKSSEDAYWKIQQQNIKSMIEDFLYKRTDQNKKKRLKLNRYFKKQITKNKLKNLYKITWWIVSYDEDTERYRRWYLSGAKGYAKYCSKRKIRNNNDFPLKGAGYRKCFDYWWTVF